MIRFLIFLVAASLSTASAIPATSLIPSEVSGNLSPSSGTPHRASRPANGVGTAGTAPTPSGNSASQAGSVTVSTEVAGAVTDGPGSTVSPGAKVGTALQAMKGHATYYPTCKFCAAASGELQDAIGKGWKDSFVTVSRGGHTVILRLDTGCGCSPRDAGWQPIIDLSEQAFDRLLTPGERARGRDTWGHIEVVVEWQSGPTPTAPATDTED